VRVKSPVVHDDLSSGRSERGFARTFAALGEIFAFTKGFYLREGIAPEDRFDVDFAVEEIFTNFVKYDPGSSEQVTVALERVGDRLRITIVDPDSAAFDPSAAPVARTDAPLEERTPGGLGIQLTRKLVDGMDYTHSGRTSTVTLTKRLR